MFGHNPALRFDVVMDGRNFELLAPNAVLKKGWLAALSSASNVKLASVDNGGSFIQSGWLFKLSGGKSKKQTWEKRFFRLRNDDTAQHLQYFKSDTEKTASGTITTAEVQEVRLWSHETDPNAAPTAGVPLFEHRFEVRLSARVDP